MSAGVIIAVIAICIMVIAGFAGNIFWLRIIEEVDRKKPELNLYSDFNYRWDIKADLVNLCRNCCPDGKLHIYMGACFAVAAVCMIVLLALGATSLTMSSYKS